METAKRENIENMDMQRIAATAQALIAAASFGTAVATKNIEAAAGDLSQQWGDHQVKRIEDEISKEIRKQGGTTTSSW